MIKTLRFAVITLASLYSITNAYPYAYRVKNKNCPQLNVSRDWHDYLTSEFARIGNLFSIRMDHSQTSVGFFRKNRCYTSTAHSSGKVTVHVGEGRIRTSSKIDINAMSFRFGEIEFFVGEAGEVFTEKMGLVGSLYCAVGSTCGKVK